MKKDNNNLGVGCCSEKKCQEKFIEKNSSPPPNFNDLVKITIGLTIACFVAAMITGAVYFITEPIKQKNIKNREKLLIKNLLGLDQQANIFPVKRFLSWDKHQVIVSYLLPKKVIIFNENNEKILSKNLPEEVLNLSNNEATNKWFVSYLSSLKYERSQYVGRFFIAYEKQKLIGYVIEGSTIGYKAHIRYFVALNNEFRLKGIEVIEHEEDPGLGAEITEDYFKNQFAGRSFEQVKSLSVIKDPLPDSWKKTIINLNLDNFNNWLEKNKSTINNHPDIYAITGATISSEAVTRGIKQTLNNFYKRIKILEKYL